MKDLLNKIYRSHSTTYTVILFIVTTLFIVYLFPKNARFKYKFEKGKPWQSENLYAPFDFAIKKTNNELALDKKSITDNAIKYFNINALVFQDVKQAYANKFDIGFESIKRKSIYKVIKRKGKTILDELYDTGFLHEKYPFNDDDKIIILNEQVAEKTTVYSSLKTSKDIKAEIDKALNTDELKEYTPQLIALFYDIIKPNLIFNKSLTENSLNEELKSISATHGSVERGTLLISKGEIVNDNKFRVLTSLESDYKSQIRNKANTNWILFARVILVAMALLMLMLFIKRYRSSIFKNNTKVTFIFFNIVLQVVLTTLVLKYNVKYLYIVPICISPLVLKAFFDARLGLFVHTITVLLLGFVVPNSYEYMFIQIIAGIVTILTVSEISKRVNLFISVGEITLVYIITYFAFYILQEATIDAINFKTFSTFIFCGLATLFVQPLIYIYEKMFGLVSDISLLELSDTNSKLLKELSNTAPGTFHHSLNVANLAEAAANEIGANAMLVRVGALYHDVGKMKNPKFFTENQVTGINAHDELPPEESVKIILNHVIAGIEIAKKYNLPDRIIDFIRTHHGTSTVYYFYKKALEKDETISIEDYSYTGPKPFSKETAILMMCDSVEAASKSLKEPTSTKINDFVESILNKQMEEGQFLNSDITFKEIQSIKKVLKYKLANIYHLRIEYPE